MVLQPVTKGYKPKRTIYKLDFSGTELEGLEVGARGSSMGEVLEILEGADSISDLQELDEQADAARIAEQLRAQIAPFARKLVSWNLLDDADEPVPASLDGLLTQELGFIVTLITAYGKAMTQAPPPLPATSPSGSPSQEELATMASLSSSLPSS